MRGRMTNDVHAIGVFIGDDCELRVRIHQVRGIHQLAIDFTGQCGFGQTAADALRDLCDRDRRVKTANRTVWERDVYHDILCLNH